ncbi:MAG: hypothetical protein ACR2N5_05080, partial [Solirubrobacterales bacterium]
MPIDLEDYRERASRFLAELDREYYVHLSGQKQELEIEPIYEAYDELFSVEAVSALRDEREGATAEKRGRAGALLQFAVDGHLGLQTRAEEAELARLEATEEVVIGAERHPYRGVAVAMANEAEPSARAELEAARDE